MADIFISYASHDLAKVEPVVGYLTEAGYTVWWDRKLQGGTMFSREIEAEVQKAKVVVVVWSPASLESRWVADEVDLALQTGKLVPISIDSAKAPMGYRQIQTIDFTPWRGGHEPCLETLLEAIAHHTSGVEEDKAQGQVAPPPRKINDASIAVLPFVDMSPENDQEYFTDGISEELLNLLSKIPQLQVTARTSSFSFKGTDKQLSEIGETLGVAHILEGSMRKAGSRIRVTAQLIKADTNFHVWSDTYNGTLDDIFEVQDEIAASIVKALKEHLLGDVSAPEATTSKNVEAYEYYLKGQQLLTRRVPEEMEQARTSFEAALKIDPNYAPAMVGLADSHYLLSNAMGCYGQTPASEASAVAMPLLERALEIDPDLAEAYTIRSMGYGVEYRFNEAIADGERASELNPNSVRAWRVLMQARMHSGNPHFPTMEIQEKTLLLDPLSRVDMFNQANVLLDLHRIDEAREMLDRIRLIDDSKTFAEMGDLVVDINCGNYKEALRRINEDPELQFNQVTAFGLLEIMVAFGYGPQVDHIDKLQALDVYSTKGNLLEANRLGPEVEAQMDMTVPREFERSVVGQWYSLAGNHEKVLELLAPYIPQSSNDWGPLFNINNFFKGARLCLLAASELGKEDLKNLLLDMVEETAVAMNEQFDGEHVEACRLKAIAAALRGDKDAAISNLEIIADRQPILVIEVAFDETFKSLSQNPRFLEIIEKSRTRIALEKLACFEAGLLPPSPALTAKA